MRHAVTLGFVLLLLGPSPRTHADAQIGGWWPRVIEVMKRGEEAEVIALLDPEVVDFERMVACATFVVPDEIWRCAPTDATRKDYRKNLVEGLAAILPNVNRAAPDTCQLESEQPLNAPVLRLSSRRLPSPESKRAGPRFDTFFRKRLRDGQSQVVKQAALDPSLRGVVMDSDTVLARMNAPYPDGRLVTLHCRTPQGSRRIVLLLGRQRASDIPKVLFTCMFGSSDGGCESADFDLSPQSTR